MWKRNRKTWTIISLKIWIGKSVTISTYENKHKHTFMQYNFTCMMQTPSILSSHLSLLYSIPLCLCLIRLTQTPSTSTLKHVLVISHPQWPHIPILPPFLTSSSFRYLHSPSDSFFGMLQKMSYHNFQTLFRFTSWYRVIRKLENLTSLFPSAFSLFK